MSYVIRLDELSPPRGPVDFNSQKATSVLSGTDPGDAVNRGQLEDGDISLSPQSGTTYQFALTDAGKAVLLSDADPITATVPANATVAFPVGTNILVYQTGAGQVTLAAAGGVTLRNGHATLKSLAQWRAITLLKIAADEWIVDGALAES